MTWRVLVKITRVNDFSFGTFFRKLSVFGALATAGLLFYGGSQVISDYKEKKGLESIVDQKKDDGLKRLDRFIADYDYVQALKVGLELKDSNVYSEKEILDINSRVSGISEEGLYERIKTSNDEKKSLAEKFLDVYPKSLHRKDILEEFLLSKSLNLYKSLTNFDHYDETYNELLNLEVLLERYSTESIDLTRLQIDKVVEEGNSYLEAKGKVSLVPVMGTSVLVGKANVEGWPKDYLTDRESIIPEGTKGLVNKVEKDKDDPAKNKYRIYFSDFKSNVLNDYDGSTSNINGTWTNYYASELKMIPAINQFELFEFKSHLDKLKVMGVKK